VIVALSARLPAKACVTVCARFGSRIGYHRPFPGAGGYRTHIGSLYLCGSSSHPGGNITGLPEYNADQVILADLGIQGDWMPPSIAGRLGHADRQSASTGGIMLDGVKMAVTGLRMPLASGPAGSSLEWNTHSLSCGPVDQRGMTRSRWRLSRNGPPMLPSWTPCSSRDSPRSSGRWRARAMRFSFSVHPAPPKLSSASLWTRGRLPAFSSPARSVAGRYVSARWRRRLSQVGCNVRGSQRWGRFTRFPLTTNASFCARVSCFTAYSRARAFPTDRNAS